jgi:hypothetical protein
VAPHHRRRRTARKRNTARSAALTKGGPSRLPLNGSFLPQPLRRPALRDNPVYQVLTSSIGRKLTHGKGGGGLGTTVICGPRATLDPGVGVQYAHCGIYPDEPLTIPDH